MVISVQVLPLETWLTGSVRPTWAGEAPRQGPRRSGEEARRGFDAFVGQLEGLLGFRPEWNDAGPALSATIFSVEGFARPFLQARQWAYRLTLPRLCDLEAPQIWIPVDFEPVLHLAPPWDEEGEWAVASSIRVKEEFERLLQAFDADPAMEELREGAAVAGYLAEFHAAIDATRRLHAITALAVEQRLPVFIEG